jgi:hypothetical protein
VGAEVAAVLPPLCAVARDGTRRASDGPRAGGQVKSALLRRARGEPVHSLHDHPPCGVCSGCGACARFRGPSARGRPRYARVSKSWPRRSSPTGTAAMVGLIARPRSTTKVGRASVGAVGRIIIGCRAPARLPRVGVDLPRVPRAEPVSRFEAHALRVPAACWRRGTFDFSWDGAAVPGTGCPIAASVAGAAVAAGVQRCSRSCERRGESGASPRRSRERRGPEFAHGPRRHLGEGLPRTGSRRRGMPLRSRPRRPPARPSARSCRCASRGSTACRR